MAPVAPRVAEPGPTGRHEPPVVAVVVQGQLEHPEGLVVADLAVGIHPIDGVVAAPPSADDELPDTSHRVGPSVRVLRREALVVVIMTNEHDVGSRRVQLTPEAVGQLLVAVAAGAESGVVPVGERALGAVSCQVGLEPPALRAREIATSDRPTVRVQRDEMPRTDVIAVVAAVVGTSPGAEVPEVPLCASGVVLVVAGRRVELGPETTPGRCERPLEVAERAVLVLVVAQEEDPGQLGVHEQIRRGLLVARSLIADAAVVVVVSGAAGDVTRSRDDRRALGAPRLPHPAET